MNSQRMSGVKIFVSPPENEEPITSTNNDTKNNPEGAEVNTGSLTPEDTNDSEGRKPRSK